jgi:hypothetical protein
MFTGTATLDLSLKVETFDTPANMRLTTSLPVCVPARRVLITFIFDYTLRTVSSSETYLQISGYFSSKHV